MGLWEVWEELDDATLRSLAFAAAIMLLIMAPQYLFRPPRLKVE